MQFFKLSLQPSFKRVKKYFKKNLHIKKMGVLLQPVLKIEKLKRYSSLKKLK
jgi:hypothetical protein